MTTWSGASQFDALPAQLPLPSNGLYHLNDWQLVTVTGQDAKSYLQGQLTCDVVTLDADAVTFAAHCDAKGKMHTVMRLFSFPEGYAYLQRKSVSDKQVAELRKYAIFSKVDISPSEHVLLGLSGEQASEMVDRYIGGEGRVRHTPHGCAVLLDDRWLLSVTPEIADQLSNEPSLTATANALWDYQEIQRAIPRIDDTTWGEHIPQALNLQAIDGISFNKGCYTGQETVARAKYRGTNKRAMFIVNGHADTAPQAGDTIERQVGENWRRGGVIIAGTRLDNGEALALCILPNDLDADTALRLADAPDHSWTFSPLPYSLDDDK